MMRRRQIILSLLCGLSLATPLSAYAAQAYKFSTPEEKQQQFLAEMAESAEKTEEAIKLLKNQIEEARDALYVPDLYFHLAELYVEKSRYLFLKRKEENPGQAVKITEAPEVLDAKTRALETYQGILKDYPRYRNNDKIHFFMGHEYKELGRVDDMLSEYRIIIRDFPKSPYLGEAYLLIGDYHFDRRELRQSKENYRAIIVLPESKVSNMARYKLAWVYINEENNKEALALFEAIARSGNKQATGLEGQELKINIIREALIDSVLCYTEVREPKDALAFYRALADDEITYIKVLHKLANRYYIRNQLKDAATLYREALRLNPNMNDSRQELERLYEYTRKSNDIELATQDITLLVQHMSRYFHSWRIDEKDRLEAFNNFERSARDVATKLHAQARQSNNRVQYQQATSAYKQYMGLFGDSKFASEMQKNYAEALYSAGNYVKAGKEYEKMLPDLAEKDQQAVLNSAIFSYFEALKDPDKLNRLEVIEARRGFITAGTLYADKYPDAKETPNLRFSIARAYYDLSEYDDAIRGFAQFIDKYPDHPKATEAGHLALDSYHFKKDFEGMTAFGKGLLAKSSIRDPQFKKEINEIIQQAEFKSIETAALTRARASGVTPGSGSSAERFLEYGKEYKQSELGEKAIFNAFITAKKEGNSNLVQRSGEELITQFPRSAYLKDVYPTMGNLALESGDYDQAAGNFEVYSEKFGNQQEAGNLLYNAATIRRLLGDYDRAAADFQRVLASGKRADLNEVRWQLALTYEEAGQWDRVAASLQDLIARGRNSVEANFKLGKAYMRRGQAQQAFAQFRQGMAVYAKLPPAARKAEETEAAGGSRFMLMLAQYDAFRSAAVRAGVTEEKVVQEKTQMLGTLEREAQEVSKYGSAQWAIAAFYIVANAYAHFADFLGQTSVPAGLNAAQKQQYAALLAQQTGQLRNQGKQTLNAAINKAYSSDIFNDYVKACITGSYSETQQAYRNRASLSGEAITAREKYRQILLRTPRNIDALNGMGKVYLDAGDYYLARLLFLRAIEVGSRVAETYNGLGVCLWQMGKHQEAYFQFKKAMATGKSKRPFINQAALYKEYGNVGKAQATLKQAGGVSRSDLSGGDLLPTANKL